MPLQVPTKSQGTCKQVNKSIGDGGKCQEIKQGSDRVHRGRARPGGPGRLLCEGDLGRRMQHKLGARPEEEGSRSRDQQVQRPRGRKEARLGQSLHLLTHQRLLPEPRPAPAPGREGIARALSGNLSCPGSRPHPGQRHSGRGPGTAGLAGGSALGRGQEPARFRPRTRERSHRDFLGHVMRYGKDRSTVTSGTTLCVPPRPLTAHSTHGGAGSACRVQTWGGRDGDGGYSNLSHLSVAYFRDLMAQVPKPHFTSGTCRGLSFLPLHRQPPPDVHRLLPGSHKPSPSLPGQAREHRGPPCPLLCQP